MSINVNKSILVIKSYSVIELFFAVSLKLWGLGLRWYFEPIVPGSVECRRCCLLYITLVNSLSSASSTSSSTVLWCCWQRPERMPRRTTACSRCRSSRSPTMSLRRTRASQRRLTWRWCGLKQLSPRIIGNKVNETAAILVAGQPTAAVSQRASICKQNSI